MLYRWFIIVLEILFVKRHWIVRLFIHLGFFVGYGSLYVVLVNYLGNHTSNPFEMNYYYRKGSAIVAGVILAHISLVAGFYWKGIKAHLFTQGSYERRLFIHLVILCIYSIVFIINHQLLSNVVEAEWLLSYKQLWISRLLVICMFMHLAAVLVARRKYLTRFVTDYFFEPGSPFNLGVFRMYFFLILGLHLFFYVLRIQITWTYLPNTSRVALPYMDWFIMSIPITPNLFYYSTIIAGAISLLIAAGVYSRFLIWVLFPFLFYSLGVPMFFGKISHYHIFLWVPLFLSFSPMDDAFSIRNIWIKNKNPLLHHSRYMLPFKFIWLQMAIIYFFAGIIKLWDCGLNWAISNSMIYQMQWEWIENYDKVPAIRIDHYPFIAKLGGLAVIYFELLYVFLIFKPKGRIWAFLGAFSFHKLAGYFMCIDFANLRMVQLSLIKWNKIIDWVKSRWRIGIHRNQSITVNPGARSYKMFPTIIIGSFVLSVNFLFSVFKIHSFPFSSYPTYSAIVKNEVSLIRMEVFNEDSSRMDVKELGLTYNFRWENIRPYEQRIIQMYHNHDTTQLQLKLEEYWLLWAKSLKELEHVKKVDMYEDVTELAPEKRNIILRTNYIGTVYPEKID